MVLPLWKRAALVPLLLFALWLLTDDDYFVSSVEAENINSDDANHRRHYHHHLAVFTALMRHRPCMRVYRSLLEINLLLWGGVISLWLWKRTIGNKMIGYLLFQNPDNEPDKELLPSTMFNTRYFPIIDADEIFIDSEESNSSQSPPSLSTTPTSQEQQEQPRQELPGTTTTTNISETDALDAQYDSDGEISEPQQPQPPSAKSNDDDNNEPPTAEHLAGVALDSLILILVSIFLFTFSSAEGGAYVDGMANISAFRFIAIVAAPIFPLLLFVGAIIGSIYPWNKRRKFWKVISFTIGAPFYDVTFRDGFVGDIITSSVRPMQDMAFTMFYLLSGLRGWWKQSYDLDDADQPLEKNWILHTWVLPGCMISPLLWRFLQNLRQVYDNKKRWPYMGNALKYFIAAEVGMFGLFDPSLKKTFGWISWFVLATSYQIWWDVFMDWELLVIEEGGRRIRLRNTRIYSGNWMYWTILGINVALRFCWTLSFLPPRYLNSAGVLSETFKGDILDPLIASMEIIRRTLWGFLRVELEAIKVARSTPRLRGAWSDDTLEVELKDLSMEVFEPSWKVDNSSTGRLSMKKMSDIQILIELTIYAVIFSGLGMFAAAHRMTY